jgi:hypothetical protein
MALAYVAAEPRIADRPASELDDALRAAFGHDGPAPVDVRTQRLEVALPPKLSYGCGNMTWPPGSWPSGRRSAVALSKRS